NTSSYGGYTPSNGATYTIISNGSGAVSGTFKNLAEGAIVSNDFLGSGIPASISYIGGDGNDVVLTVDASLAVTLHSLSAVYENGSMSLHWVTDSETENVGFVLELENSRSPLRWEVIASHETHDELRGQGNSSERHEYVFIDNNVEAGQSYVYRLSDVNTSGEVHVYDDISIDLPDAPEVTVLDPPFPNPFNPQTKISYQLAETGSVEIIIYDLLGRKVQSLVSEKQIAGSYNMYWHGDDEFGQKVATGTYLIVLKTVEGVRTQKVVMLR
ncbi:T9SS type A sorting domain-containing protein, partial [bacterium]|nr:T9SS type A sorting domain-containing protein [bacterium]